MKSFRSWWNTLKAALLPGENVPQEDFPREALPAAPGPISPRVGLIVYDPIVPTGFGTARLTHLFGWNDPDALVEKFIADIRYASYGYVSYRVAERVQVNEFPRMADGFRYSPEAYVRCWQSRSGFHQPDRVDYGHILSRFEILERINRSEYDEVWGMCFPYGGFYESRMGGPGAFFCNSEPMPHTGRADRRFVIMCFNPERGVGEMLESYGHRAEFILEYVFRAIPDLGDRNLWRRFRRYHHMAPGRAEVGDIHFAPNSLRDYDWGNRTPVPSHSRACYQFPDLSTQPVMENCAEWGNGDIRAHHLWWFRHLPHVAGQTLGISNNWWEYIADPHQAR